MRCENDNSYLIPLPRKSKRHVQRYRCPACELHSAAIAAGQAAAERLTRERFPGATYGRIWFNDYGFFADVDGVHRNVGTAKESAPFWELSRKAMNAGSLSEPVPDGSTLKEES